MILDRSEHSGDELKISSTHNTQILCQFSLIARSSLRGQRPFLAAWLPFSIASVTTTFDECDNEWCCKSENSGYSWTAWCNATMWKHVIRTCIQEKHYQSENEQNKAIQIMQNKTRKYVRKPKKSVACALLHSKGKIKIRTNWYSLHLIFSSLHQYIWTFFFKMIRQHANINLLLQPT